MGDADHDRVTGRLSDAATASRIAAAVTVAATVPATSESKRSRAGPPDATQKTTSPSNSENTGSTARATPPLAMRAIRVHDALSSAASVITHTSVVLRSSKPVHSGGRSMAAIAADVEVI